MRSALPLDPRAAIELARARAPREACGLLLAARDHRTCDDGALEDRAFEVRAFDGTVEDRTVPGRPALELVELPNRAADPTVGFELDPGELCRWLTGAPERVRGVWHSHPEGPPVPSRADVGLFEFAPLQLIVGRDAGGGWAARAYRRR